MNKLVFVAGLVFLFCSSAQAQDEPRVEIFGAYSYLNADTNNLASPSRQSANGWEASASWNYNRWFAVEGDISGYYKTERVSGSIVGLDSIFNLSVHDYGFVGGPRLNFRPAFFHALVGGDHLTGSVLGFSASQNSLAGAFGGGVEWDVAPRWAVRGSADYVLTRHNIFNLIPGFSGPAYTQNSFRVSAGVVLTLGGEGNTRSHGRAPKPNVGTGGPNDDARPNTPTFATNCSGTNEAPLLGVSGCTNPNGFLVAAVRYGSPAAVAGVKPGDVVTSIDGRPVQTSLDIDRAMAANTTAILKLSYMIKGTWLTEQEVKKH